MQPLVVHTSLEDVHALYWAEFHKIMPECWFHIFSMCYRQLGNVLFHYYAPKLITACCHTETLSAEQKNWTVRKDNHELVTTMYALQKIMVQRQCTHFLIYKLTLTTLPLKQNQLLFSKLLLVAYYTSLGMYKLCDNCFIISCAPEGSQPSTVLKYIYNYL
jgi:hypothetical protein